MEFWRLPTVVEKIGLSKTTIYRLIRDGTFPKPHAYPGTTKKFWLSSEVQAWQRAVLSDPLEIMLG